MRIALADDSALFRAGLASLLSGAGVEVTASAGTGEELLRLVRADPPEVVVLDMRMPPTFTGEGMDTAEALWARHPGIGVLVLSTYAEPAYAVRLLEAGTAGTGYLLKDRVDDVPTLCDALERLRRGEAVIDPGLVRRLLGRHRPDDELARLTDREREVLRLMAEGRSNAGIGAALYLSPKTVEAHVARIFTKLGLESGDERNRRVLAVLTWLRSARPGSGHE